MTYLTFDFIRQWQPKLIDDMGIIELVTDLERWQVIGDDFSSPKWFQILEHLQFPAYELIEYPRLEYCIFQELYDLEEFNFRWLKLKEFMPLSPSR